VNLQAAADSFADLAQTRIAALLRLNSAIHVYDPTPGALNSVSEESGLPIILNKWKTGVQPYRDLDRFAVDDRVMQSVIDPGLLPIAKAISIDVRSAKILVTRKIALKKNDPEAVAHLEGYGIRILIYNDETDTIVDWQCLYGIAG
jgi:hypothetical protein